MMSRHGGVHEGSVPQGIWRQRAKRRWWVQKKTIHVHGAAHVLERHPGDASASNRPITWKRTSDNLEDSQEEAEPESSQASDHATALVPLTPDPTPEEPAPGASAPERVATEEEPPQAAAPRCRRPNIPAAGAQVDARVLDYLRRG